VPAPARMSWGACVFDGFKLAGVAESTIISALCSLQK